MKTKTITALTSSILLFLLIIPAMTYAASVTISQSGADTGTIMKGRSFTVEVSGLSGSGSVNLIDPPSGFTSEEGTSKSFSDGTTSVTWTTTQISQAQNDVKIKANVIITGSPTTAESTSFNVVLPPSITLSVTPASYTNVVSGSDKTFYISIPNTGQTSAKSVIMVLSGTGSSIENGCDTITSVSAGGSSSSTCTASFTQSGTFTFTATPSNADSKSDSVSITVLGGGSSSSGTSSGGTASSSGGGTPVSPLTGSNKTTDKSKANKSETSLETEKVTASNRPKLVPGVGLRGNEKLQAAIEKVLAKGKMSETAIQNMLRLSASIAGETETERAFEATDASSKLTTRMKYMGKGKAKNFIVYEKIPKSFAESSDEITVIAAGAVEVVEKDPEYAIVFSELNPGQTIEISYTVNKNADASVIDAMSSEVYAESVEVPSPPRKKTATTQPSSSENTTSSMVIVLVLLVLVAILAFVMNSKKKTTATAPKENSEEKNREKDEQKPEDSEDEKEDKSAGDSS